MSLFETLITTALAALLLIWLWPGFRHMIEKSRQAESRNWPAFLIPMALIALFVFILISLAAG